MSGTEQMVAAMASLIGVHETNGDNTNIVTHWYGMDGAPWCNMAITYAAWHSGNQAAVCFGGKFAYTVAHAQAFKDHGQWHADIAGIRRGDVVFMDWGGTDSIGNIDHVELVESVDGTTVHTIGGNFENRCDRWVRHAHEIAGYGRPSYIKPPEQPPTPKPPAGTPAPQYTPYPGSAFFHNGQSSAIITRMGRRLDAKGFGRYVVGPGPDWSDADKASYAAYQRSLGYKGVDANGIPGKVTWDLLKVPK